MIVQTKGLDKLTSLILFRVTTLDTGQPLMPTSGLRAWGVYVLFGVLKIDVASNVRLKYTYEPSLLALKFGGLCTVWGPKTSWTLLS